MVQNMLKRWSGNFQTVLWPVMLALGLAALVGCSSGGGDSAGFLSSGSPRVYAGDATLTCANETDMIACRGIKYAQAQRFAASQLVELTGSIDATEFGSACV